MTEPNDDIIKNIKTALQHHEEPYQESAWERFAAMHVTPPRKKHVKIIWIAAAAAAIIGVILFARIFNDLSVTDTPPNNVITKNNKDINIKNNTVAKTLQEADKAKVNDEIVDNNEKKLTVRRATVTAFKNNTTTLSPNTTMPPLQPSQQPLVSSAPMVKPENQQKQQVDFWKNNVIVDNKNAANNTIPKENNLLIASTTTPVASDKEQSAEKNSRWQPSLYVSPLFGDLGVNMGYGFSLGYAINDKLTISSGIAHTKISTSHAFDDASGPSGASGAFAAPADLTGSASKNALLTYSSATSSPSQVRTLQQVSGSLSGIDIPVEVNYRINKKLYATAGISALVVINDNKTYTFADSRNVKISVETNKGTLKEDRSVMFNEQGSSNQPSQIPTENTPMLGFYNISLGYRQKISDKNAISLEPFIKVPMKNVTQQNLKYMGTGIRLKFDL